MGKNSWIVVDDPLRSAATGYATQLSRELRAAVESARWRLDHMPRPVGTTDTAEGASAAAAYNAARADLERQIDTAQGAADALDKSPEDWNTIHSAEVDLLRVLDEDSLRRRAWFLRERFTAIVGSEKAARYLAAGVPDIKQSKVEELRADLVELQREMFYNLNFGRQAERERARLLRMVSNLTLTIIVAFFAFVSLTSGLVATAGKIVVSIVAVLVALFVAARYRADVRAQGDVTPSDEDRSGPKPLIAVMILLALFAFAPRSRAAVGTSEKQTPAVNKPADTPAPASVATPVLDKKTKEKIQQEDSEPNYLPTMAFVALAGLLGSAFSLLQRTQTSGSADPRVALFTFREAGFHTFLISMLCGLISALVVYAVFASRMLEGSLFPNIVNGHPSDSGFALATVRFLRMSGPASTADHAKLLVWAFIGGFSERFVPDILDRFVSSTKK